MIWEIIRNIILAGIISCVLYCGLRCIIEWQDYNNDRCNINYKSLKGIIFIFSISIFVLLVWLILFF